MNYSVLGLGDTSYEHFCKMGKDFDTRLEVLGATRVNERKIVMLIMMMTTSYGLKSLAALSKIAGSSVNPPLMNRFYPPLQGTLFKKKSISTLKGDITQQRIRQRNNPSKFNLLDQASNMRR